MGSAPSRTSRLPPSASSSTSTVGQWRAARVASEAAHSLAPGAPLVPTTARMVPSSFAALWLLRRRGRVGWICSPWMATSSSSREMAGSIAARRPASRRLRSRSSSATPIRRVPTARIWAQCAGSARRAPARRGPRRVFLLHARCSSSPSTALPSSVSGASVVEQQRLELALGERGQREDYRGALGHGRFPWLTWGDRCGCRIAAFEEEVELCVLVCERERGRHRGLLTATVTGTVAVLGSAFRRFTDRHDL